MQTGLRPRKCTPSAYGTSPGGGGLLSAQHLISYVMKSITEISRLRRLSPPLWCLTAPPFPRCAGALWMLSNVPHDSTRKRRANLPLRGRRRRRRQKGCISLARRAVGLFSCGRSPVVKVLFILAAEPPTTTLSRQRRLLNLSTLGAKAPSNFACAAGVTPHSRASPPAASPHPSALLFLPELPFP